LPQATDIAGYAKEQISARLGRLVFEIHNTAKTLDVEAIHDLRVAIRRFSQSLAAFTPLLPKQQVKKVRKRLRRLRNAAGEVRDRDIALALLAGEGFKGEDGLCVRLVEERKQAERTLVEEVRRWTGSNLSEKWRTALQLDQP
jgi:CHAD domain-containing protein